MFSFRNTPVHSLRKKYRPTAKELVDPVIGVITAFKDPGSIFLETICSMQCQTFVDWEWLIVDDGSTQPESAEMLEHASHDHRVRIIRQTNAGPGAARNHAARVAQSRFFLYLDSDDLLEPTALEKLLWYLGTHPKAAFCNGWNIAFGDIEHLWPSGFEKGVEFIQDNYVHISVLVRREAHEDAGGFSETFRPEDWDYWLRLASVNRWGVTFPEYLSWYRRVAGSRFMTRLAEDPKQQKAHADIERKYDSLREHFPNHDLVLTPGPRLTKFPAENLWVAENDSHRILVLCDSADSTPEMQNCLKFLNRSNIHVTIVSFISPTNVETQWAFHFTTDIFYLNTFLSPENYLVFLEYLLQSRSITTILSVNSTSSRNIFGYLRLHNPEQLIIDYAPNVDEGSKFAHHIINSEGFSELDNHFSGRATEIEFKKQGDISIGLALDQVMEALLVFQHKAVLLKQTQELLKSKTEAHENIQEWVQELDSAKNYVEDQRAAWQATAENALRNISELQTYIEEILVSHDWLTGQVVSWQQTAQMREVMIVDLKTYQGELLSTRDWLTGQVVSWQQTAEAREAMIADLKTYQGELLNARDWLTGQVASWQQTAEAREQNIAHLRNDVAALRATLNSIPAVVKYYLHRLRRFLSTEK